MAQYFKSNQNISDQLNKADIKYGICVGRRQPMHIVHIDCLQEIAAAGLEPIIIMGSMNPPSSKFYDKENNPLDEELMRMQIKEACKIHGIKDYKLLALEDVGNMKLWVENLTNLLLENNINPAKSAFHFRKKTADNEKMNEAIKPLSEYQKMLMEHEISVWESHNQDKRFDSINSAIFRGINLLDSDNAMLVNAILAAPEFIIELAEAGKI